ncbi:hypothetical protein ARMGADRAFT_795523 [Armillaria gallica]|uniref:Uncharacterized protein n=1 Tax=Armillaria gallica TaxID=47427 RepID=A0A2H3E6L5_ARMGA|nr:hypothetical protein ARMGADRAFT_795523 [Armillaria gallica]
MTDSEKRPTRSSSKSKSATPSTSAGSKHTPPIVEPTPQGLTDIGLAQPQKPSLEAARSKIRLMERLSSLWNVAAKRHSLTAGLPKLERNERRAQMPCLVLLGAKSLAGISPTAALSFSSYAHDRKIISLSNIPLGPVQKSSMLPKRLTGC